MRNKYFLYILIYFYLCFYSKIIALTPFQGNTKLGFTFSLFPHIKVDYFNQYIFIASNQAIPQNNQPLSFNISAYDIKNNNNSEKNNFRFIPIITKNAVINGILEANPLYESGCSHFNLLLGLEFEPKFYIICNPINSSQIYIINNLELYNNEKNKLIATEQLLDIDGNPGEIIGMATLQNNFTAITIPKNTIFDGISIIANCYDYQVKEKIIPLPGSSNYLTFLQLSQPNISQFSSQSNSLLMSGETNVTILPNSFSIYGNLALNKAYIGISGQGTTGIKTVSLLNEPLLASENESAINGNNIVITNQPNTNLYCNFISSILTTTGLTYIIIVGGTNDAVTSQSTVYALPIINNAKEKNTIGTLANINQQPSLLFNTNPPYEYIGNIITASPINPGDLYQNTDQKALVGNMSLLNSVNGNNYQLRINNIEGYKDTIFISTTYSNNDANGIGGVFYSQALFNEYGSIQGWTNWQRKNIIGNCETQTYVPSLGVNVGIYENHTNQIFIPHFDSQGPFINKNSSFYTQLPCSQSGIEKIIDIPYTHPGIGNNVNPIIDLKPSYSLSVGYNTVILQQTSKNNNLLPILQGSILSCDNGTAANINTIDNYTTMITFQGGALDNAGALFTGALSYTTNDCWITVAGANGVFILANPTTGEGCGQNLLQDNFIGISTQHTWQELGDFTCVKKIISNQNFLYIMTNNSIYRIEINNENILQNKQCEATLLLQSIDLPQASKFTSFSDMLCCGNTIIIASSVGLFTNSPGSTITIGNKINIIPIILPEGFGVVPLALYPITKDGNLDSWGNGNNDTISGNIYLMATSISEHYSKIYRLVCYGNSNTTAKTIFLLPNYFLKDYPTYYYDVSIELLSIATDGASIFSHGIYGNSILYRSFIGILNPFIKHGNLALKNEYNFFELTSKVNSYFGFPTYISGNGAWLFSGQNSIQGLC